MKNINKVFICILSIVMICALSGCAMLDDMLSEGKRGFVGQEMTVTTYDHYGNPTLKISGTKVHVGLLTNSANFDSEDTGYKSEVLEVTVNSNQCFQVGNTMIIEEKGLNKVTDFETPEEVDISSGGGIMYFDRLVNNYKNMIGEPKTVIVSSQLGIPIAVYQGEEVFVKVSSNLPKMTILNIDGKTLCISRANYVIVDSDMIQ